MRFALIAFVVAALAAGANPLKTDKGNTIGNLQFFPDGVVSKGIQILPSGWVTEDGSGPPGKPVDFTAVKEWTDAEKKKI